MPPSCTWPNASTSPLCTRERALPRRGALGDDHDGEVRALAVPVLDPRAHLGDVERHLGHEHDVGAARHPGVDRDPTGVTAHHLDDHHAVVALGGGVQPVDGIGRDLHRGVEPEGEVGGGEVVVDGLGHPDDGDARLLAETRRDAEGVLAADHDQRVDPLARQRVEHPRGAVVGLERVGARRAEDGAAAVDQTRGSRRW